MARLNQKDIEGFKALLEIRRTALEDDIRAALTKSGEEGYIALAGEVHTASDESFAEALTGVNLAIVRKQADELQDIIDALARIRAGSYGVCTDCGMDIPIWRLGAYPTAKRCTGCQREHEGVRAARDATPSL